MNIAMFIDNAFVSDLRVIREAEALKEFGYSLTVYAMEDKRFPVKEIQNGIFIYRIIPDGVVRARNQSAKKKLLNKIGHYHYDVIHCHDQYMLQLGADYKRQRADTILIYDSHELFYEWPLHYANHSSIGVRIKSILARKYQIYLEKQNIKMVDYVITVNDSIAKILKKHFRLNKLPLVLLNTYELKNHITNKNYIRNEFNIPDSTKILVYIGAHLYRNGLKIDAVIKEFSNKKDIALLIISASDFAKEYYVDFVKKNEIQNIFFKKFISRNDIVPVLSSCDVGLVATWDKKHLSYWYALDSKIFLYLMAGLPTLATAQPEYLNLIEQDNIGVCINPDEQETFANGLHVILNNYDYYCNNVKIARQKFNWEKEKLKLAELYSKIQMNKISN